MSLPYRQCVVAVFFAQDSGKVLLGERRRIIGAWQFPQGGVEEGETYEEALRREMKEEVGVSDFKIMKESSRMFSYDFPSNVPMGRKYKGQEQKWFLCEALEKPDLTKALDKEFSRIGWFAIVDSLDLVIWWKRQVYEEALRDLLGFQ